MLVLIVNYKRNKSGYAYELFLLVKQSLEDWKKWILSAIIDEQNKYLCFWTQTSTNKNETNKQTKNIKNHHQQQKQPTNQNQHLQWKYTLKLSIWQSAKTESLHFKKSQELVACLIVDCFSFIFHCPERMKIYS